MSLEPSGASSAAHARRDVRGDVVVAHSSDLHLGSRWQGHDDLAALTSVLAATREAGAHVLLLAGDIFDHNRVPLGMIDRAARALADAALPVVVLPGNHDPITPDSVYRRGGLADPPNVDVLGVTVDEHLLLPDLGMGIWGRAHADYVDMSPLASAAARKMPHEIVMAHGHWVSGAHDMHRSWLIHDHEVEATAADYVALGHWDRAEHVGTGSVPAYYSGSPDLARSINLVRLRAGAPAEITRHPVAFD